MLTALALGVAALGIGVAMVRRRLAVGPAALLLLALYWLPHVYLRAGGDGLQSFAVARSLLFDRDLRLENDYAGLKTPPSVRARDGRAATAVPIGTALVWLPALAVGHAVALAWSRFDEGVSADGFSAPYAAAAMLWTFGLGIAALLLLERWLRPRFGAPVALLAVVAVWLATSLHYYLVVTPSMSHGPQAAVAILLFLAWMHARTLPATDPGTLRAWLVVGLWSGAAILVRPQDVALLALPLGDLLLRREPRWRNAAWLLAPLLTLVALQAWVWLSFHGAGFARDVAGGRFGAGFATPQPLLLLFSARHGLVTWTPAAGLALVGLGLALRREGRPAFLALLAVALSVSLNSAFGDWWGSDSFGQRRLVGLTPLLAFGLAHALDGMRRRPLVLPALLVALLVVWNVAFTGIFNRRLLSPRGEAVSLDRLAAAQVEVAYDHVSRAEGWLPPTLFFLLYDNLRGIYIDEGARSLEGVLELGAIPEGAELLGEGWSQPQRDGERLFRRGRGIRSTLRVPVRTPGGFEVALVLRSSAGDAAVSVKMDGRDLYAGVLAEGWSTVSFRIPEGILRAGFNDLVLEWTREGAPARGGVADVERIAFSRPPLGRKGEAPAPAVDDAGAAR